MRAPWLWGMLLLSACRTPAPDAGGAGLEQAVRRQAETALSFETHAIGRPVRIDCPHRLLPLARRMRGAIAEVDSEITRQLGTPVEPLPCAIGLAAFEGDGPAPRAILRGADGGELRLLLAVRPPLDRWTAGANQAVADAVLAGLVYAWTRRALAPRIEGHDRRWVVEGIARYVAWRVARQADPPTARRMAALWTPEVALDRPLVRQLLLWWDGPVIAPVRLEPEERLEHAPQGAELARARRGAALQLVRRLVAISGPDAVARLVRSTEQQVRPGEPSQLFARMTSLTIHQAGSRTPAADLSALTAAIEQVSQDDAAGKRHGLALFEHLARKYRIAGKPTHPPQSDLPRYLTLAGTQAVERLGDRDPLVRLAAARALAALGREELDAHLAREWPALFEQAPESALWIVGRLRHARSPKRLAARRLLLGLLDDPREPVRREAIGALRQATGRSFGYDPAADPIWRREARARWGEFIDRQEREKSQS